MLDAIGHVALVVRDPARTALLFRDLFNATILLRKDPDGHEETFVRLGRTWFVLVKGTVDRPRTGDHIAFAVSTSSGDSAKKSSGSLLQGSCGAAAGCTGWRRPVPGA